MTSIIAERWVKGIPRTFGNNKRPGYKLWVSAIGHALSDLEGIAKAQEHESSTTRYAVSLEFTICPGSKKYRASTHGLNAHGPDLDNLTKPVLDCLSKMTIITDDCAVFQITESKVSSPMTIKWE